MTTTTSSAGTSEHRVNDQHSRLASVASAVLIRSLLIGIKSSSHQTEKKSKRPINLWTGHAREIMRTKVEKSWAETDKHLEVGQGEEEEDEEEGESHLRGHE